MLCSKQKIVIKNVIDIDYVLSSNANVVHWPPLAKSFLSTKRSIKEEKKKVLHRHIKWKCSINQYWILSLFLYIHYRICLISVIHWNITSNINLKSWTKEAQNVLFHQKKIFLRHFAIHMNFHSHLCECGEVTKLLGA